MSQVTHGERQINRWSLNFGFLGGGIAWVLHLLLTYAISEFGCTGEEPRHEFLGVNSIAWLLLAASAVPIALSGLSVWTSNRLIQKLRRDLEEGEEVSGPELHTLRIGVITNGLFVLIIVVQTIPIFYYLRGC